MPIAVRGGCRERRPGVAAGAPTGASVLVRVGGVAHQAAGRASAGGSLCLGGSGRRCGRRLGLLVVASCTRVAARTHGDAAAQARSRRGLGPRTDGCLVSRLLLNTGDDVLRVGVGILPHALALVLEARHVARLLGLLLLRLLALLLLEALVVLVLLLVYGVHVVLLERGLLLLLPLPLLRFVLLREALSFSPRPLELREVAEDLFPPLRLLNGRALHARGDDVADLAIGRDLLHQRLRLHEVHA
mmetsp:Transcript_105251/g.280207  ORF Transcript_105251/g.280207 Transcript_105251/m.280207 type:complete len:245 (-) Transcript_105251:120-854(-)